MLASYSTIKTGILADYNNAGAVSQHLVLEARTLQLRLVTSLDKEENGTYKDCAAVSLDNDLDLLLAASWTSVQQLYKQATHSKDCSWMTQTQAPAA